VSFGFVYLFGITLELVQLTAQQPHRRQVSADAQHCLFWSTDSAGSGPEFALIDAVMPGTERAASQFGHRAMSTDIFGDLREWNRVLRQVDELQAVGKLDEHQEGLARLLRYRFNWRVRRKAVESLSGLAQPHDQILFLVLEITADDHTQFDLRTLAADSLCGLIAMRQKAGRWNADLEVTVIEKLGGALKAHQPPEFEKAIKRALSCAGSGVRTATTA
jgi:hypothetical protein